MIGIMNAKMPIIGTKMAIMNAKMAIMNAKMAIMNTMIAIMISKIGVIETLKAPQTTAATIYFNANLMVSAKASGIKLISGRISSSGFQSSERFTGALGNL